MIALRKRDERGHTKLSWLDSRHTFSFGAYCEPRYMAFSDLRVINEDGVAPGGGLPTHSHRDMEIITYVLEGALAHKDSTGSSSVIRAGDVQRMTPEQASVIASTIRPGARPCTFHAVGGNSSRSRR